MENKPSATGAITAERRRPCQPQLNTTTNPMVSRISSRFLPVEKMVNAQGLFLILHIIMVISLFIIHHTVMGKTITHVDVTRKKPAIGCRKRVQTSVKKIRLSSGMTCALVKNCWYSSLLFL